eukprot:757403-Hanusia_phi.AAC.1
MTSYQRLGCQVANSMNDEPSSLHEVGEKMAYASKAENSGHSGADSQDISDKAGSEGQMQAGYESEDLEDLPAMPQANIAANHNFIVQDIEQGEMKHI